MDHFFSITSLHLSQLIFVHSYLYGYWFNDWRPALVNQIQQAFQPTQPPAPGTLNFNTQGYASIDIDNVQYSYEYNGQRIDGYDLTPYDQVLSNVE